jgi:AcrR family transcriptional regulator
VEDTPPLDPRFERTTKLVTEAVLALMEEHGPEGVTHQRVAERAGVGRATVYRHWPTSWDLIRSAVEPLFLMNGVNRSSARDTLIELAERICDLLDGPLSRAFWSLISQAERNPAARALLDSRIALAAKVIGSQFDDAARTHLPLQTVQAVLLGPLFYERFVVGRIVSRDKIPAIVDMLLATDAAGQEDTDGTQFAESYRGLVE